MIYESELPSMTFQHLKENHNRFFASYLSGHFAKNLLQLGSLFMTSYILYLGIAEWQISMLSSIIGITGIMQIFVPKLLRLFSSRKKSVLCYKVIQYMVMYLLVVIPKIFIGEFQFYSLLLVLFVFNLLHSVNDIGLIEWNDVYVPVEKKSVHYATRNLLYNLVGVLVPLVLGKILDHFGGAYSTYAIILLCYFIFIIVDLTNIYYIEEPEQCEGENNTALSIKQCFSMVLRDKKYRVFLQFNLLWNFAFAFGNVYCTYYAIKYQHLSMAFIGFIGGATCFVKMLIARVCGRKVDELGWKKVLYTAGIGFGAVNVLWLIIGVNPYIIYPLIVMLRGVLMITTNIAKFQANLLLGNETYRIVYLSVNGCALGAAHFISSNIVSHLIKSEGFWLRQLAEQWHLDFYLVLFTLSGILQILSVFYFMIRMKSLHKNKACTVKA